MLPMVYIVLVLWRMDYYVAESSKVKNVIWHQTSMPIMKAQPTMSLKDLEPDFNGPIKNVTVALGREAILTCSVSNIGDHKVAWIRAEDQTILTLHKRLVVSSPRYAITNYSPGSWQLHIRQLRVEDRGCYMCQMNTKIMKKQIGCVDVLVPPKIIDEGTSGDLVFREGQDVTLSCNAEGRPLPQIRWRRENVANIQLRNQEGELREVDMYLGSTLNLTKVERRQMGPYLCIASNDVPPSVSKRIMLSINFPPSVLVATKVLGVLTGATIRLECFVEAHPAAVNYWLKGGEEMILAGRNYNISEERVSSYQIRTMLYVSEFSSDDIGAYTCRSSNTMGKSEGNIRLYEIKVTTTTTTSTTTTTTTTTTTPSTTTTEYIKPQRFIVTIQPAEQKHYTPDSSSFDLLQNVIEQSVLDNNWLPTTETTGSRAHQVVPLSTFTILIFSSNMYLLIFFNYILNLLKLFADSRQFVHKQRNDKHSIDSYS